jgi:hypothetical protein
MTHQVHPVQLSLEFERTLAPPSPDPVTESLASNVVSFQAYRDVQQSAETVQQQLAREDVAPRRLYQSILDSIRHFAY